MPRLPSRPTVRPSDRLIAPIAMIGAGRLVASVVVVIGLAGGAWWMMTPSSTQPAIRPTASVDAPAFTLVPPAPVDLVVHVVGAVERPGVYRLDPGSRVIDAVEIAGGPRSDAVLEAVNLAAPLTDGQRIRIPTVDDPQPIVDAEAGTGSTGEPLDINAADVDQLVRLPGIGPALATAIVRHRERHGPFEAVDDLIAVSGIGAAKLEVLRPLVTVGGSS